MKFISWNVNGLRAALDKGFKEFFTNANADFFCIQETKMQEEQKYFSFDGYYEYWNSADKKGYSGTLIYTKHKPINVIFGINGKYNDEGRAITLEYRDFYIVNVYSPNSQEGLKRLKYRMEYEDDLRTYLLELSKNKYVILCGDLNCAHEEIDIKNPKANVNNAGFSYEEREKLTKLLQSDFIDSFRFLYPTIIKYTWWSYRFNARLNNAGWRIDYFIISKKLSNRIIDSFIYDKVLGSDHCPIGLEVMLD